jgi:hypothetical protein
VAEKAASKSKYALKVQAQHDKTYVKPVGTTRPRRVCDDCRLSLAGRRGHGFVSRDGRRVTHMGCR